MMGYKVGLICFVILTTGCASSPNSAPNTTSSNTNVDGPKTAKTSEDQKPSYQYTWTFDPASSESTVGNGFRVHPLGRNEVELVGEQLSLRILVEPHGFKIDLENKTSSNMAVLWDESVYIDTNRRSFRIIPGTTRVLDKNASVPPSPVGPRSTLETAVVIPDRTYYNSYLKKNTIVPILPHDSREIALHIIGNCPKSLLEDDGDRLVDPYFDDPHVNSLIGKTIALSIPVTLDENKLNLYLELILASFTQDEVEPLDYSSLRKRR